MDGSGLKVLVVGAGVAGLATARALRSWGATVEVVEQASGPQPTGAGIYLPGNAVRALQMLDLRPQVTERAVTIDLQRVSDHRGRLLFEVDVADLWRDVGPCLSMPRADLHQVLLSAAGDIPIRWQCSPETIVIDGNETLVTFGGGAAEIYGLVVGADGVHSTVRRLVFGASAVGAARAIALHAWRFLVPWDDPEPIWTARLGAGSTLVTIPVTSQCLYCYCDAPPTAPPRSLRRVLAEYAQPAGTILDILEGSRLPVHSMPIEEVIAPSWSRGPVLLVGDAAHATSPSMAEGAAMAIEDAIVLVSSLESAPTVADALRGHEERRRPRTDWVLSQTRRRDRTRRLPPVLRDLILRRAGQQIFRANYRPLLAAP